MKADLFTGNSGNYSARVVLGQSFHNRKKPLVKIAEISVQRSQVSVATVKIRNETVPPMNRFARETIRSADFRTDGATCSRSRSM